MFLEGRDEEERERPIHSSSVVVVRVRFYVAEYQLRNPSPPPREPSGGLENPPRVGVGYRPEWRRRLELRRRAGRGGRGGRPGGGGVPRRRAVLFGLDVVAPDVEVDDKVHVDLLDADGEGVGGVEGDGDEGAA